MLKQVEGKGKAFLRLSREGGIWRIKQVAGDPYFRVLLFDTVSELDPAGFPLLILSDVEYPTIRIYLSFETASPLDQTFKPILVSSESNKIRIRHAQVDVDAKWNVLAPIHDTKGATNDKVALNLLGVGALIFDALKAQPPGDDADLRRLRLSPAFIRPIGK